MKIWRIGFVQSIIEECTVDVEAENDTDAERLAREALVADGFDGWRFSGTMPGEPECITCEIIPGKENA